MRSLCLDKAFFSNSGYLETGIFSYDNPDLKVFLKKVKIWNIDPEFL